MKNPMVRRNFLRASLASPLLSSMASLSPAAADPAPASQLWPSFEKIQARLENWAQTHRDILRLEVLGQTAHGRALYALHLNDPTAPEQDKEHVLITTQHSGIERSGTTSVLLLLEWLLSGDPGAREILRRQNMIAMPVVNPDGYVAGSHANSMGQDPYTAWSFEGPKDPAKTPEAVAVQTMMDRHQPELHADLHGIDLAFPATA